MLSRFVGRLWRDYVVTVRDEVDAQAQTERTELGRNKVDRRFLVVILTFIGSLVLMRYFGRATDTRLHEAILRSLAMPELAAKFHFVMHESPDHRFNQRLLWAIARLCGYGLIPLLVIRFVLRERIGGFGTKVRGVLKHWRVYAPLFVLMAPVLFIASHAPAFLRKYPYYKLAPGESLWPFFWGWELLYAAQFVALEFFYRGFAVHGFKQRLGYVSIFVMIIPYTMIHFGKPMPEAVGAIITGFVLGTLSLKSNSVWWGAAIHITVACGMDILSVWHKGYL